MSRPAVAPRPPRCTRRRLGSPGFAGRSHGSLQFGHVMADAVAAVRPHAHDGQRDDRYCDPPVRALRPVIGEHSVIWTFTGGSGGSVKTALAASREAAEQLLCARQLQHSTHGE